MGQALKAAHLSMSRLSSSFLIQSYHCYFIGPVQSSPEVIYKVDHLKIGTSFCTVLVNGIQNSRIKFHCMVSFQKTGTETHEIDYCTRTMPVVPKPVEADTLQSRQENVSEGKYRLLNVTKDVDRILDVCICVKRNHTMPPKPK